MARQTGAHFPQPFFHTAYKWHSNRPSKWHQHEIKADRPPILAVETAQPLEYRLIPRSRTVKPECYFRCLLRLHQAALPVPKMVRLVSDDGNFESYPEDAAQVCCLTLPRGGCGASGLSAHERN